MSTIAYGLRAEYEGTVDQAVETDAAGQVTRTETVPLYLGGLLSIDDERDLNVADELEQGGGRIVVEDTDLLAVNVLDGYEPLKRVTVDDAAPLTADQYADTPVGRLDDELRRRGITGLNARKELKVAALHADDRRITAGVPAPAVYTVEALAATDGEA